MQLLVPSCSRSCLTLYVIKVLSPKLGLVAHAYTPNIHEAAVGRLGGKSQPTSPQEIQLTKKLKGADSKVAFVKHG